MKRPTYKHFNDLDLLIEADRFAADPLVTELALRLEQKIEQLAQHECLQYPKCDCDVDD